MKFLEQPVAKKQHKQKKRFRSFDEDQFGPRQNPKDNYKRKIKHRNNFDYDNS
jgi:hypothetical protein